MFESSLNNPITRNPDYSALIAVSSGYVADKDGVVLMELRSNNGGVTCYIDGYDVIYQGSSSDVRVKQIRPISQGQKVTGTFTNLQYCPYKE